MRNVDAGHMHVHRYRSIALGLLACLLPFAAAAQESHTLTWCHDGVDVVGFRVYAGTQPTFTGMTQRGPMVGAAERSATVDLPNAAWYFAVTAVGLSAESDPSNVAPESSGTAVCDQVATVPGPVRNLVVTLLPTPIVTVSLTAAIEQPAWNEWFLTISAAGSVRISANGTTRFDWVRQGAAPGGAGGTAIATTPALGVDEDGLLAQAITLNGPISGARADFDGATFSGAQITLNGVTKALVRNGSTWSTSFP